jgi:hypothetical protein
LSELRAASGERSQAPRFIAGDGFQQIDAGRERGASVNAARPVLSIVGDGFQQIDAGRERGAFGERSQARSVHRG